jgi:hypothetical protein
MKKTVVFLLLGILIAALWAGCVAYVPGPHPYSAFAPGPPPDPIIEVRPAIPFPEAVWLAGFWALHAGNWVWNAGRWDRRPHPGAKWHPGQWHHEGPRGWGFRPGHWR